jgi:hypothetical protein
VSISQQDRNVRTVNLLEASPLTARTRRQIAQLERTVVLLQSRIDRTTTGLVSLESQVNSALASLSPPNPRFTKLAASNAAIIAVFVARPPFGIPPVTSSQ